MKFIIPEKINRVIDILKNAQYDAYLVGGCVRDLAMGKVPKDFDVTTNAKPESIMKLFEDAGMKVVYENVFGTVMVIYEDEPADSKVRQIEITPYRRETKYSDFRHPDAVMFADTLQEDLMRRDFTMNAIAWGEKRQETNAKIQTEMPNKEPKNSRECKEFFGGNEAGQILRSKTGGNFLRTGADFRETFSTAIGGEIIDPYDGLRDIARRVIRTVGDPNERFTEDALRMLRAVRFAAQLGFAISGETADAIVKHRELLKKVSAERIRDEFVKIINCPQPIVGISLLSTLKLVDYVVPELLEGVGCFQGGAHKYDVFEHLLHACQHAADKNYSEIIRITALFHDIGKPRTKREGKNKSTFYGHEVVGARMTSAILNRLKFPRADADLIVKFVRWHMFFSDTESITLSAVRRMIQNVGKDHIWDLMKVRECDRVGMAKTEAPYRLRKYFAMIEECLRDPISVSQLAIDGNYLMKNLGAKPGPRMGWTLHALLEEVLEDPKKNTIEKLAERAVQLEKFSDADLRALGETAKEKKDQADETEIKKLRVKHGVK